jgi:hypothetical protein
MNGADELERMTGLNKSNLLRRGGGTSSAGARKNLHEERAGRPARQGTTKVFLRVRGDHEPYR